MDRLAAELAALGLEEDELRRQLVLRKDAAEQAEMVHNTTAADALANWTIQELLIAIPANDKGDFVANQAAKCQSGMLLGAEVQKRFLDSPHDPRVLCPSGEKVPAVMLHSNPQGKPTLCRTRCCSQTCTAISGKDPDQITLDGCLMRDVWKTYKACGAHGAPKLQLEDDADAVSWVLTHVCLAVGRGYTFTSQELSRLQRLDVAVREARPSQPVIQSSKGQGLQTPDVGSASGSQSMVVRLLMKCWEMIQEVEVSAFRQVFSRMFTACRHAWQVKQNANF
ncbi:NEK11 [Symbiodinium sp. KB8]|nr:NEK11 [Symbiodinium sp. KB8]